MQSTLVTLLLCTSKGNLMLFITIRVNAPALFAFSSLKQKAVLSSDWGSRTQPGAPRDPPSRERSKEELFPLAEELTACFLQEHNAASPEVRLNTPRLQLTAEPGTLSCLQGLADTKPSSAAPAPRLVSSL